MLREIGEVTIPDSEGGERTLAGLLSLSPLETVVRRLEAAAAAQMRMPSCRRTPTREMSSAAPA